MRRLCGPEQHLPLQLIPESRPKQATDRTRPITDARCTRVGASRTAGVQLDISRTEHAPASLQRSRPRKSQNFTPHVHRTARRACPGGWQWHPEKRGERKLKESTHHAPREAPPFLVLRFSSLALRPPTQARRRRGTEALRSVRAKFHRRPPPGRTSTQRTARRFPLRFEIQQRPGPPPSP